MSQRNHYPRKQGSVLIVGGGIGGIQSALDLADGGFKVYVVEKDSSIGGTMSMLDKTFPTGDCAMCMLSPKIVDLGRHPDIEVIAPGEVVELSGQAGDFTAKVRVKSRYVDLSKCTGCSTCVDQCPVSTANDFDQNLSRRTAIHRRYPQALPGAMTIEKWGASPCRLECPAEVNAHAYIALTAKGRFQEALGVIRRTMPFPASIGRVCTHPCEHGCRRKEVDQPISICALKRFLTDREEAHDLPPQPEVADNKGKRVAIVGAGPAGLTAARDLAKLGYRITVFEKLPVAGGMLAVSIPAYRLPKRVVQREIDYILSHGVQLELGKALWSDFTLDSLKSDGFAAVALALGTHKGLKLQIPGEDEFNGVSDCIEFLRKVSFGEEVEIGKKVVVVGGGNAAVDSARTALRLGAQATIVYRRSRNEMPANSWEIEEAEAEGVVIRTLAAPIRVLGENGKAWGVRCLQMELGEADESGRQRPVPVEGSEFVLECDSVITAIGQEPEIEPDMEGALRINRRRNIEVNPITLETSVEGVFACGDVVSGPSSVVAAIGMGRRAADSIHRYLSGQNMIEGRKEVKHQQRAVKGIEGISKRPRSGMPKLPIEQRKGNFKEVELGFDETSAVEEANRCLNCSGCCECYLCVEACEAKAIKHERVNDEERLLNVGAVILSPGLDRYRPDVRGELGFGRWPNVVTSIQFERILSASGPYKGEVKRPGDGKHPVKVAWIQCVGSRDPHHGSPWCSSVCCMYATKQAIIAREHDSTIEPVIFYVDMRAFGKDFDKYVERAKNEYRVRYQRAMVSAVREEPGTGNLILRFAREDGVLVDETFDLVVLSVGLQPHADVETFAKTFGIETTPYRFAKTNPFEPVETSREGVFVTGSFQSPKDIPETVMQGSAVAAKAMALLSKARGTETITNDLPPERQVSDEEIRMGVFVCSCGTNIASTVDVHRVVATVKGLEDVVEARNMLYACSPDSQSQIRELIREKRLNRVVVASCTPRTHTHLFQETIREAGLNKYLFELADIREQCSWCHMGQTEKATQKAEQIVSMTIAKARRLEPVKTGLVDVVQAALIVGGGIAGMTAALALAAQAYAVHLVERDQQLGGLIRNVHRTLGGSDVQQSLKKRVVEVENNPRIAVHVGAEVRATEGFVGNFKTTLSDGSSFAHGAVIVATGGAEYEPNEYCFGESNRVMTQRDLERWIELHEPKPGERYVMIQCVGSREEPYNYCSRICCQDAVKNAIAVKEKTPNAHVLILYRDIRTYGLAEEYYSKARNLGVLFMRFEPDRKPQIVAAENGLKIRAYDHILNRHVDMFANLLVLSTGLRPRGTAEAVAEMYKIPRNADGFFLEAHVKLRPVDFPAEGLFVAGLAHGPKRLDETISQALAAAGRVGRLLSRTKLEVSGIISKHNRDLCMSCLSCLRLCPFGAPFIDEDGRVSHNEVKCTGCGICAGVCPAKAFQVNNFTDDEILAMIDIFSEAAI